MAIFRGRFNEFCEKFPTLPGLPAKRPEHNRWIYLALADKNRLQRNMPLAISNKFLKAMGRAILDAGRDLAPIIAVIAVFQLAVLRQPLPDTLQILAGLVLVVLGLAFFVVGLDLGLFPFGETLAEEFARKGSLVWLLVFAFALGFGTTVAEPALIAVTMEGARAVAEAGLIAPEQSILADYALRLRLTVALSVGIAIVFGVLRILRGWPLPRLIVGGYVLVMVMTIFAPQEIVGLAYDSGGVTTSTVTVPLVTALGVGLARTIRGRDPLTDGFGLIALASLTPMIFVMLFGILMHS
ncbi:MAG: DUF1538 domain-containing protein [Desulfovibrio sp.]|nr:DUF1538 domain-containing protein [Desulfovibrio sp.]